MAEYGTNFISTIPDLADDANVTTAFEDYHDDIEIHLATVAGIANAKQDPITGAASSVTTTNLSTNRAMVSDANGKIATSAVTSTQLGYLTTATGSTGSQSLVYSNSPTISSPSISNPAITGTVSTDLNIAGVLRVNTESDVSPTSTGHSFQIGPTSGTNLALDGNEIMARANGAVSHLYLNNEGGSVTIGNASSAVSIPGTVTVGHFVGNHRKTLNNTASSLNISTPAMPNYIGEIIRSTNTSSTVVITLNPGMQVGDSIDFLRGSTGELSITATGVNLVSEDNKRRLSLPYSGATVICVAADTYHLVGSLKT